MWFPESVDVARLPRLYLVLRRRVRRRLWARQFGTFGRRSVLEAPLMLNRPDLIEIGTAVVIRKDARLEVVAPTQGSAATGQLRIGNGSQLEFRVQIAAALSVHIDEQVLIGSDVLITDHNHTMPERIEDRILSQPLDAAPVRIGRGVWIGSKAVILRGVSIGAGAVVGASAVVTKDVAPGQTVAGIPARPVGPSNGPRRRA